MTELNDSRIYFEAVSSFDYNILYNSFFFYVIKKSCFRQKCFLGYYQYSWQMIGMPIRRYLLLERLMPIAIGWITKYRAISLCIVPGNTIML